MKTFLRRLSILACLAAVTAAAQQSAPSAESRASIFEIGGRKIIVPAPPGDFVRVDGVDEAWDKATSSVLPASNRLLGMFASPEAQAAIRKGMGADTARNFNIQVLKSLESREIGERTFGDVRRDMRRELDRMKATLDAEMKKLAKSGTRKLEDDFGVKAAFDISDTVVLGIFEESATALGFTMALKVAVSSGTTRNESRSVVACIMAPVNGRLVNLYSCAPFAGKADQDVVEATVKQWRAEVVAANPRVQGPPGGFDWGSVGRTTVIGAIVGGLVGGLAAWLARRRKARAQP